MILTIESKKYVIRSPPYKNSSGAELIRKEE